MINHNLMKARAMRPFSSTPQSIPIASTSQAFSAISVSSDQREKPINANACLCSGKSTFNYLHAKRTLLILISYKAPQVGFFPWTQTLHLLKNMCAPPLLSGWTGHGDQPRVMLALRSSLTPFRRGDTHSPSWLISIFPEPSAPPDAQ